MLSDVCEEIVDCLHETAPTQEEGIPSIRTSNIENGRLDIAAADRVSEEVYQKWTQRSEPQPGDIILAREAPVGEVGIVPEGTIVCLGQRTVQLRPDRSKVAPRYLLFLLLDREMQNRMESMAAGSTVPHLNLSDIREMELPELPPLPVQRRIADILGALDDKIELNRRMNETLEEMAQTLYYCYFDGSVERGDIGLEELVEIKPRMPVPDDDEVLTYVGMADVEPNRMSVTDYGEKEYTSGRRFVNHDTLMARITPSLENGKTAFVDFLDDGEMAFGSTEFTVMRAGEDTSPYFVYCCARDERFREYAISTMTGSSGRQRVQENLLGEYVFENFDQSRMDHFHDQVEPLFELIRSNTSENQTLAETRDYLLPKLISGEIEVGMAEEVAGSVIVDQV
jgi:type I restriction enzyme S subunit